MMKSQLKKYNMMLTEKKQKYQQFNLENLINLVILQIKKCYHLIKAQALFTYSSVKPSKMKKKIISRFTSFKTREK